MARRAFDTVGDDDLFLGSTDEHRISELFGSWPLDSLEDAVIAQDLKKESDAAILARLGLDTDPDDELAFEARWGDDA